MIRSLKVQRDKCSVSEISYNILISALKVVQKFLLLKFCIVFLSQISSLLDIYRQLAQKEKAEKERKKYTKRRTHLYYTVRSSVNSELSFFFILHHPACCTLP